MSTRSKLQLILSLVVLLGIAPFAHARVLGNIRLGLFERVFEVAAQLLEPAIGEHYDPTSAAPGQHDLGDNDFGQPAVARPTEAFMPFISFQHFSDDTP